MGKVWIAVTARDIETMETVVDESDPEIDITEIGTLEVVSVGVSERRVRNRAASCYPRAFVLGPVELDEEDE